MKSTVYLMKVHTLMHYIFFRWLSASSIMRIITHDAAAEMSGVSPSGPSSSLLSSRAENIRSVGKNVLYSEFWRLDRETQIKSGQIRSGDAQTPRSLGPRKMLPDSFKLATGNTLGARRGERGSAGKIEFFLAIRRHGGINL